VEAERWKQIEKLCQAALAQPPEKRAAFLAQACPDDAQLRAEVQALLNQETDSFLESAPLSTVKALSAGGKLGNFEIVELLGRGGMGEVWRARDTRLKRDVAIKVLPAGLARDPDRIARFEREARAASALNHPNIVAVHDVGCDNGTYWIATELVRGDTLRRMIEAGPLPAPKVIDIAAQVAAGLAAAHAAGLVHRDLKPDNIMVTRGGQVKILDFGLAKQGRTAGDSTATDLTGEGVVMGTAGYMAPEQVRGEAADHRSDLFSFGVVLHEMLSGKRAFSGSSSVEVMHAILKDEPAELPASVPPELGGIVRRCLEKEPDRRFQSAADLAFALRPSSPSLPRAAAPKRRAWLKWATLAGSVVAGAALYWLTRPLPPPRITATVHVTNDGRPKNGPLLTDGSRVFFTSGSMGNETYQVSVKGGESLALPLPVKDAFLVDISPDRTELLLCRPVELDSVTLCELWVAPLLGGSARRLGDLVAQGGAAAWSPDGQQVVYARNGELHIARSDGTEVRKLATIPVTPSWVRWSPDGSRVRFSVDLGTGPDDTSLWEARIDGNRAYPLLPGWAACCGNWTPDGRYFVFQAAREPYDSVWILREKAGRFQRTERGPFQLTTGPLAAAWPVPSTDGKHLYVGSVQFRYEFLRYDLKSGQLVPAFGGLSGTNLEFSKDGKWVAYVSVPDGSLWRGAADGSQRLQLTSPPISANLPHWSPDGKQIAFMGSRKGNPDRIYVVSFDGGAIKQVTNGESGKEGDWDPSWSPEGASLAFGATWSARASASIHVVDLKTSRVSTLPGSEGMWSPRWSPNGRFIAGLSPVEKIVLYDFQTHKQSELSSVKSLYPGWSVDGESLFYETEGDDASWWRVRMGDRKTERVTRLKNMQVTDWFAPAPNNSLITARSVGTNEIYALDWELP
jgi:serine/threonine protein kinase/Tol biopolymer transport system component